DTDIWCGDPKWMRKISAALEQWRMVHPFATAYATDAQGECGDRQWLSFVKQGLGQKMIAHPGYGWAVQRSLLEDGGGFFDCTIGGNGDWFLAYACKADRPLQQLVADNTHEEPVGPPWVLDEYEA